MKNPSEAQETYCSANEGKYILLPATIIDPRAHIYNTKSIGILIDNLLIYIQCLWESR